MKTIVSILAFFAAIPALAQKQPADSMKLIKQFMQVCTGYKQLPLQLTLEYKTQYNVFYADEDTSTVQAFFHVQKNGAYIKFGEAEQIITDSAQLMVMPQIRQMVLTTLDSSEAQRLKASLGIKVPEPAIEKTAARYTVVESARGKNSVITMASRDRIANTELSFEEITLVYDPKTQEPKEIKTLKRDLVIAPDTENEPGERGGYRIVNIPGKGRFAVREQTTWYVYKTIGHDPEAKLPVVMTDRIERGELNQYAPVKTFSGYYLQQN